MAKPRAQPQPIRQDRRVQDTRHDPYRDKRKPSDDTVCRGCGLGVRSGRWQRASAPWAAKETLCPACKRAEGGYPAGFLRLSGPFFCAHRGEIEALLANVEAREARSHPLQRRIELKELEEGAVLVTTTGSHLARALADAVHHAYGGSLQLRYADQENLVRAAWER